MGVGDAVAVGEADGAGVTGVVGFDAGALGVTLTGTLSPASMIKTSSRDCLELMASN